MLTHLKEEAVAIPDKEERVKFVPGTIRGKQVNKIKGDFKLNFLLILMFLEHFYDITFEILFSMSQKTT